MAMSFQIGLFPGAPTEWNLIQKQLANFCLFYYNISQMHDKPDFHIIEDDFALDAFLAKKEAEEKKAKINAKFEKKNSGGSKRESLFI